MGRLRLRFEMLLPQIEQIVKGVLESVRSHVRFDVITFFLPLLYQNFEQMKVEQYILLSFK